MAIKVKSRKPPKGAGRPKKKGTARHGKKKAPARASTAAPKHATESKSLLARKPVHRAHGKKPFVRTASHAKPTKTVAARMPKPVREFVVAAAPAAAHPLSIRKKKKKPQMVLRFTENTLKDIAALECVRRCFR